MTAAYVLLACRALVGLVFVVSAAGKLRGRRAYAGFVSATARLAPGRLTHGRTWRVRAVAAGVLAAEAAVPLLLGTAATARYGFALAGALLAAFALAIRARLSRGGTLACHCFGATALRLGRGHLARDAGLCAVAGLGLALTLLPAATMPAAPPAGLAAGAAGAFVAVVVVLFDDIVALYR